MAGFHVTRRGERNDSLIGINAVILNNSIIGSNCLIGANALIRVS